MRDRPTDADLALAAVAGRAPADPAQLGAGYGLGQYEQAQLEKDYPRSRALGLLLFPVGVICIPTAVIGFTAAGPDPPADFEFGLIWAPIVGLMCVVGALLIWRSRPLSVKATLWYSGGLLQFSRDEPEPRVIRWADVVSLCVQIYCPEDYPASLWSSTVSDSAGTSIRLGRSRAGRRLPRAGLASPLAAKATELLLPAMLPGFIRQFDAGERISFGDLWIDSEGVGSASEGSRPEAARIAWPDITAIHIDARTGVRITAAHRSRDLRFDLGNVPNGFFAHYLIEHAAAAAGIGVRYYGETRMPRRATEGLAGV